MRRILSLIFLTTLLLIPSSAETFELGVEIGDTFTYKVNKFEPTTAYTNLLGIAGPSLCFGGECDTFDIEIVDLNANHSYATIKLSDTNGSSNEYEKDVLIAEHLSTTYWVFFSVLDTFISSLDWDGLYIKYKAFADDYESSWNSRDENEDLVLDIDVINDEIEFGIKIETYSEANNTVYSNIYHSYEKRTGVLKKHVEMVIARNSDRNIDFELIYTESISTQSINTESIFDLLPISSMIYIAIPLLLLSQYRKK